jgi:Leucine-rich repeat (LRR) protein
MGAVVGRFRRSGGSEEKGQAGTAKTRIKRWQEGSPQDANRILDLSACGLITLTKTKVWSSCSANHIVWFLMFKSFQILYHSANIRRLNLSKNSLLTFPPEIWQLECLEEVVLAHNQLSSIVLPVVPGKGAQPALCFRLKSIDLSFNAFTLFPEALLQLPKVMPLSIHDTFVPA